MIFAETGPDVVPLLPALREFVDAVNDRDEVLVEACFAFTEARTLAVLAAGWVGDLLNRVDAQTDAAARVATLTRTLRDTRVELSDALAKIVELQGDLYIARNEAA